MIREHEMVVLTCDLPNQELKEGDLGAVISVYSESGYEVEFMTLSGDTLAVVTLEPHQIRPVGSHEIHHSRSLGKRI